MNSSVKNLDFCVEVEKFKSMVSAAADVVSELTQVKTQCVVRCSAGAGVYKRELSL